MGHHPWPTGGLIGCGGSYPSAEVQLAYSTSPVDRVRYHLKVVESIRLFWVVITNKGLDNNDLDYFFTNQNFSYNVQIEEAVNIFNYSLKNSLEDKWRLAINVE